MHDPACDDFHRTDAQRRSLADRPVSRRRLLQLGLGATLSVYAARTAPLRDALQAAEAAAASTPQAPVLVTVFVPGGLDLLDTVVPVADYGRYADLRPGLKVAAPLELAGTGVGLHPSLGTGLGGGLKGLFDRGRLGLLPGIDYADPDLSHFNSRHFWEAGMVTLRDGPGWLGRWVDRHGGADNPFQGLSLSGELSPLLRGTRAPVAAVSSPADAQGWIPGVWDEWSDRYLRSYVRLASGRPGRPGRPRSWPPPGRAAGWPTRSSPTPRSATTGPTRWRRPSPTRPPGTAAGRWPSACRCSPACWPSPSASASPRSRPTGTSTPTTTSAPR